MEFRDTRPTRLKESGLHDEAHSIPCDAVPSPYLPSARQFFNLPNVDDNPSLRINVVGENHMSSRLKAPSELSGVTGQTTFYSATEGSVDGLEERDNGRESHVRAIRMGRADSGVADLDFCGLETQQDRRGSTATYVQNLSSEPESMKENELELKRTISTEEHTPKGTPLVSKSNNNIMDRSPTSSGEEGSHRPRSVRTPSSRRNSIKNRPQSARNSTSRTQPEQTLRRTSIKIPSHIETRDTALERSRRSSLSQSIRSSRQPTDSELSRRRSSSVTTKPSVPPVPSKSNSSTSPRHSYLQRANTVAQPQVFQSLGATLASEKEARYTVNLASASQSAPSLRHGRNSAVPDLPDGTDDITEDLPEPMRPKVMHWTSHSTRRREYEEIDRSCRGIRGLWRRFAPSWISPSSERTGFFTGDNDSDAGSVRRYRLDLDHEDGEGDEFAEKMRSSTTTKGKESESRSRSERGRASLPKRLMRTWSCFQLGVRAPDEPASARLLGRFAEEQRGLARAKRSITEETKEKERR